MPILKLQYKNFLELGRSQVLVPTHTNITADTVGSINMNTRKLVGQKTASYPGTSKGDQYSHGHPQ